MNAETAAAYCGERHVEDFLERVGTVYPPPRWVETVRRKFWYRPELDRSLGIVAERPTGMGARFLEQVREKRHG
jgi:hypothetical protein